MTAAKLLLLLAACASAASAPVPNFGLIDHEGRWHELYRLSGAKAVVLVAHTIGCPMARRQSPAVRELARRYGPKGVVFLMINASTQDDRAALSRDAAEFPYGLPILKDETQLAARALGLTRSAEAVVLDPKTWRVAYRGMVDDRLDYGGERERPGRRPLAAALDAMLAGRAPAVKEAPSLGCLIRFEEAPAPPYSEIAPLVARKCLRCHVEGFYAPRLDGWSRLAGFSAMTRETLLTGRMPPWDADPAVGRFSGDRALTPAETRALVAWIDAGASSGTVRDPIEGARAEGARKPDYVLEADRELVVPEKGPSNYQYATLGPPFPEDAWIDGITLRPARTDIVHHSSLVFLSEELHRRFLKDPPKAWYEVVEEAGREGRWMIPGRFRFLNGTGVFVPKGARLALEIHYTASGVRMTDRPKALVYAHRGGPLKHLKPLWVQNRAFSIAPGDPEHRVSAQAVFKDAARIHHLIAHMHARGKWFKLSIREPGGAVETLLSIPRFSFKMGGDKFTLETPRVVAAGTEVLVEGAFDNSSLNPSNPDPRRRVTFGRMTSDEMFHALLLYTDEP